MGAGNEIFGHLESGEVVERVTISGGGLTAHVLTWGAVIQDLRLDGHDAPLVLGFEDFAAYLDHSPYFGATPGRCAAARKTPRVFPRRWPSRHWRRTGLRRHGTRWRG